MNKIALTIVNKKEGKLHAIWNADHFHIYPDCISVTRGTEITDYPGELIAGFIQSAVHPVDDEYL